MVREEALYLLTVPITKPFAEPASDVGVAKNNECNDENVFV